MLTGIVKSLPCYLWRNFCKYKYYRVNFSDADKENEGMRYKTGLLFFLLMVKAASAQEMLGISNSNYSGNMGIFLNPSTIVDAPYKYEFNLIAGDFFAQNTYMYSPTDRKIISRSLFGTVPNEINWFDNYNGATQKGFAHTLIIGPSYINDSKGTEAWGFHTAYRNEVSALDVPASLAKYVYQKYNYAPFNNQTFNSNPFSAAWLSFVELGGTYGKVYMETEKDFVKWAATVNVLVGLDGLYLDARKLNYTVVDTTLAVAHTVDATLAEALDAKNSGGLGSIFPIRGMGLSTTLGVTYMHKRHPGSYECGDIADALPKYQYRAGLSLIDFGMIRFFNQDQVSTLQTNTDRSLSRLDTVRFSSLGNFTANANNLINGSVVTQKKAFTMFLPTAISGQFDYSLTKNIYANATLVNRLYFGANEVARGNQLDLSARYEKRKWEASIDYTLFEYSQSALGVGLRYSFFVLGTDRLLEWMGVSNVESFDIFFGFKFNFCDWPFTKKNCPAYAPG